MTHFKVFSITFSETLSYFTNKINRLKIINFKKVGLTFIKNNHTYFWKWYQISTNIDYWQGHEWYLCMVTCGLLTNHRHGNHVLMYERLFMPEGAARGHKKRSCTQSHSWTPFIHQFMMDHHSYAIILQIHTFNLPKIHKKPPFILPLSTFKSSRKIGDLLGMCHSKQGCALCVYIRLGA